jgi:tRNA pseudouridine38-40 synthase
MQRVALGVQYDGRGWSGWQSQPSGNTIQDVLESALAKFADEPVRTHAAGRTDTGVHATAQVVHFDTTRERPSAGWVRGVNRYLPPSVAVRWARPVETTFHARFSAISRTYHYVLYCHPVRAPHMVGRAGWSFRALDNSLITDAAKVLVGEHDFSAFRSVECQAKSPIKTLHSLSVEKHGDFLLFHLHANAFLHHMVRNIIGSLITVGRGSESVGWLQEILQSRQRALAAPTFMADGLYLTKVEYPSGFALPPGEGIEAAFPGFADKGSS